MQNLSDVALEGTLSGVELGPDGDLYAADMLVAWSSRAIVGNQTVVLRKSVHGDLGQSGASTSCRIVGGSVKPDGRFRADISTVAFLLGDLPTLIRAEKPQLTLPE